MTRAGWQEEEVESRWEAGPAVLLVAALQILLALMSRKGGWHLWGVPWWIWLIVLVPEFALIVALTWSRARRGLEQRGRRRTAALTLIALISTANGLALVALAGSLVSGEETSGSQLLLKGLAIWTTNVLTFGLWFWEIDRGGPVRRLGSDPAPPDFQFPQTADTGAAAEGWQPELVDYLYVSFTNSVAFSPTDAMPLTHRAKLLMMTEASASGCVILLVLARAVNILG